MNWWLLLMLAYVAMTAPPEPQRPNTPFEAAVRYELAHPPPSKGDGACDDAPHYPGLNHNHTATCVEGVWVEDGHQTTPRIRAEARATRWAELRDQVLVSYLLREGTRLLPHGKYGLIEQKCRNTYGHMSTTDKDGGNKHVWPTFSCSPTQDARKRLEERGTDLGWLGGSQSGRLPMEVLERVNRADIEALRASVGEVTIMPSHYDYDPLGRKER